MPSESMCVRSMCMVSDCTSRTNLAHPPAAARVTARVTVPSVASTLPLPQPTPCSPPHAVKAQGSSLGASGLAHAPSHDRKARFQGNSYNLALPQAYGSQFGLLYHATTSKQ
eukprot:6118860-Prymnesium_polylepis.1